MDKVALFRHLIKQAIVNHQELMTRRPKKTETTEVVFDDLRDRYMLHTIGWNGYKRVHTTTFYVAIRFEKIYIEIDWTEEGIATYLLDNGVEKEDIVLAFYPESHRKLTEFAVA